MIDELKNAIYTKGLTVPGLSESNFAFDKVKTTDQRPYCVFFGLPQIHDFDSKNIYEEISVQFSVFSDDYDTGKDITNSIFQAFDFCKELSMGNYRLIVCRRESSFTNRHLNVWHFIIQYYIEIEAIRID